MIDVKIGLILVSRHRRDCYLIEVKGSFTRRKEYQKWLENDNVMKDFRDNFGVNHITKKMTVYNGDSKVLDEIGIEYINVDDFLLNFLVNLKEKNNIK